MFSRAEIVGWAIAIVGIIIMGGLVAHGPFGKINPVAVAGGQKVNANTNPTEVHVSILTDPKTVGRYVPATVKVRAGESIVFANQSNAAHSVTDTKNRFNLASISESNTSVLSVSKPGVYHYYCIFHPFMKGTLIVTKA